LKKYTESTRLKDEGGFGASGVILGSAYAISYVLQNGFVPSVELTSFLGLIIFGFTVWLDDVGFNMRILHAILNHIHLAK